jgi:NAD(P)-dependent dehydrogenase (short-subunit alcohol dehydrogenase family)
VILKDIFNLSGKKILVTGGAGFLGSHLCDSLLNLGHEVISVDNYYTGSKKNIEHLQLENAQALKLDWNTLPEAIHPEVVILSDINYDLTQFETLTKLIEKFIHQGCTIILSTPQRIMASPFVLALSTFIIADYLELVDENGVTKEISIFVLSKKIL